MKLVLTKKIQHIEDLSNLLEDITTNNPSFHLLISGDFNIALDDKINQITASPVYI